MGKKQNAIYNPKQILGPIEGFPILKEKPIDRKQILSQKWIDPIKFFFIFGGTKISSLNIFLKGNF